MAVRLKLVAKDGVLLDDAYPLVRSFLPFNPEDSQHVVFVDVVPAAGVQRAVTGIHLAPVVDDAACPAFARQDALDGYVKLAGGANEQRIADARPAGELVFGTGWMMTVLASALAILPLDAAFAKEASLAPVAGGDATAEPEDAASSDMSGWPLPEDLHGGWHQATSTAMPAEASDGAGGQSIVVTAAAGNVSPNAATSGAVEEARAQDVAMSVALVADVAPADGSPEDRPTADVVDDVVALGVVEIATEGQTTFVAGSTGEDTFDVFVGMGDGNAVDFSSLAPGGRAAHATKEADTVEAPSDGGALASVAAVAKIFEETAEVADAARPDGPLSDASAAAETAPSPVRRVIESGAEKGVFVDLASDDVSVHTQAGDFTVQAWALDADGSAGAALAHLENVDNVVGTVGDDILIGNADANTFTYTARVADADGRGASYGFDIYVGGGGSDAHDAGDTADFSRLESGADEGAAGHAAPAKRVSGIQVDLADVAVIAAVDPLSGAEIDIAGSIVSTITGDGESQPLALLAWTDEEASDTGARASSSIESIIGSGGADVLLGDADDNTFVFVGDGEAAPSYYEGREGTDTADFSELDACSSDHTDSTGDAASPPISPSTVEPDQYGIEVSLRTTVDEIVDASGETRSNVVEVHHASDHSDGDGASGDQDHGDVVAYLKDVEDIVGTRRQDWLEGDDADNRFTGGDQSDTFVFKDVGIRNGALDADIGHDVITDFNADSSGRGSADRLMFSTSLLWNFDRDDGDLDVAIEDFLDTYGVETDDGFAFVFDDANSLLLEGVTRDELSVADASLSGSGSYFYL